MAEEIRLDLPARPEFLSLARLVATGAAASDPSFSDERLADLRLAVSEATTNAIEAQQQANAELDEAEGVTITCRLGDGVIVVEISDSGAGFDPGALVPHPPVTDPARLDHERGLGIPLIRLLTDDVEFEPTPKGTTVRLTVQAFAGGGS